MFIVGLAWAFGVGGHHGSGLGDAPRGVYDPVANGQGRENREVPMKLRVSIAGMMTAVAWVALDGAAIRMLVSLSARDPERAGLIGISLLPMANVACVALLRSRSGRRRGVPRPFAAGVAAAGVVALALFGACILAFPGAILHGLDEWPEPLETSVRWVIRTWGLPGKVAVGVLALTWFQAPVLVPALAGGWVARRWHARWSMAAGPRPAPPRALGADRPEAGAGLFHPPV
jgi:hypothetical protein